MFGKAMDAPGWFEYVLQRLTLMLVILGVGAEEVRGCKSDLPALWQMVLEHDDRDKLLHDGKKYRPKQAQFKPIGKRGERYL